MNNPMTYIQNGDYLIPDLKLSQQPEKTLGKYGRMRKTYLKEHRPILYNQMLLSEKLYPHLLEIDETAQSRLEQMMPQLAKEAGATEELKASNPMTYIQNGDYLIPDLKLSQQPEKPLGKYGRMRKTYLKEHRPILYNQMLLSEKLYPHLQEIDETAQSRLEQMIPQLAKEAGATEELKASDPMKWVGLMNTCKAQAEEILMAELINS